MYKVCYDVKIYDYLELNICVIKEKKVLFESKDYAEALLFYQKNKRKYRLMDRYLYIYKDEFILDKKTINECFEEGGE